MDLDGKIWRKKLGVRYKVIVLEHNQGWFMGNAHLPGNGLSKEHVYRHVTIFPILPGGPIDCGVAKYPTWNVGGTITGELAIPS